MTTPEAFITGRVWGVLRGVPGFTVECSSSGTDDAFRGEVVVRGADGVAVLITVTETRPGTAER